MTYIDEYTTEAIEEELERRKKLQEQREKPTQLESFDLGPLMKIGEEYIEFLMSDDHGEGSEWDHYIYETAVEMLYGKDVWDWINKHHG